MTWHKALGYWTMYGSHIGRDQCSCSSMWHVLLCGGCCQSIRLISQTLLLYFAIAIYQHLFLDLYLYSLSIHESSNSQSEMLVHIIQIDRLCAYGRPRHRVVHVRRNTYTGLGNVMLCTKLNAYGRGRKSSYKPMVLRRHSQPAVPGRVAHRLSGRHGYSSA